ncbi:helix-turn-helix transcriptional regulator [Plantactinospora sp. KLBMP9567]|uniref:helix-turn-helix transcriptional regulator n=1 Tax=Plantactinospora sp. KLBMP9567 TaxID=3085900 RepID=UPI0029822348|nr:LuxR C-terminal-related transcriptional regulator [Plantactinospora sp. KLBMP9567]MDW5323204.1 LuxR C-terminal-related transcriptional regulator [Plantactinospora sp. KLBMP9567]
MTTVPGTPGEPGNRVRIAISSPEILAHIRHEFASKGLEVQIDGLPAVDVVVTPVAGTAPGAGTRGKALSRLVSPQTRHRDPATARYRLVLIPAGRLGPTAGNLAGRTGGACRPLSPREAEVMDSISQGMRNADIAALLRVQQKTVKNHVNRIFTKLGARSRVEAVLIWQRTRVPSGRSSSP